METMINGFRFRFEDDEGYVAVKWWEPKTDSWERLTTLGGSLQYALAEAKEEVSGWDVN